MAELDKLVLNIGTMKTKLSEEIKESLEKNVELMKVRMKLEHMDKLKEISRNSSAVYTDIVRMNDLQKDAINKISEFCDYFNEVHKNELEISDVVKNIFLDIIIEKDIEIAAKAAQILTSTQQNQQLTADNLNKDQTINANNTSILQLQQEVRDKNDLIRQLGLDIAAKDLTIAANTLQLLQLEEEKEELEEELTKRTNVVNVLIE